MHKTLKCNHIKNNKRIIYDYISNKIRNAADNKLYIKDVISSIHKDIYNNKFDDVSIDMISSYLSYTIYYYNYSNSEQSDTLKELNKIVYPKYISIFNVSLKDNDFNNIKEIASHVNKHINNSYLFYINYYFIDHNSNDYYKEYSNKAFDKAIIAHHYLNDLDNVYHIDSELRIIHSDMDYSNSNYNYNNYKSFLLDY